MAHAPRPVRPRYLPGRVRHRVCLPRRDGVRRGAPRRFSAEPHIQQGPHVRLRPCARQCNGRVVRERGGGHQLGFSRHRGHADPAGSPDGHLHVRARRVEHSARPDRAEGGGDPGLKGPGREGAHPRLVRACIRRGARPGRGHLPRNGRRQDRRRRADDIEEYGRGGGRADRGDRRRRVRCHGGLTAPFCHGRRGCGQELPGGFRTDPRAPEPSPDQPGPGGHAYRPEGHRVDQDIAPGRGERVHAEGHRQDHPREVSPGFRRDIRQGAGEDIYG